MTRLPETMVVGYQTIKLIPVSENDPGVRIDVLGMYSAYKSEITYTLELEGHQLANTMIHELLHAIWHTQGLDKQDGNEYQESAITALANGLTQVFRDNDGLIEDLLREAHRELARPD